MLRFLMNLNLQASLCSFYYMAKSALSNSIYYGIGSLVRSCASFFLLPLYTSILGATQYGQLNVLSTMSIILSTCMTFALERSLYRLYHDYKTDEEKSEFLSTIFIAINGIGLFVIALSLLIIGYSTINGRRRVSAIRLTGLKTNKTDSNYRDHSIPRTIQQAVINRPSTILYVHSQNECDHKDGRYSEKATDIDQFQCLSKAENDAKRQHCKNCRKYNKRFDAKVLGYKIGWIKGNENSNFCEGCYWYDPYKFNEVISNNAKIN